MNKRRRVLSLVLALFMLLATVPSFIPGGMKAVAAQTISYPAEIAIIANYTSYNCSGTPLLFQGYPYWIQLDIEYLNSTGGNSGVDSNVFAEIEYYYNGQWYKVYETPSPGFSVTNGTATILINSQSSPGFINASQFQSYFGTNDTSKIPQGVTKFRVTLYDPVYGISTVHVFNVEFPFHVSYTIGPSQNATFSYAYWNGTWADDKAFVGMPFDVNITVQYYSCLLGSGIASFPDQSNLTVKLVNGSPVTWLNYYTSNPIYATFVSNSTTGQYNFTVKNLTTDTQLNGNGSLIDYVIPEKIVVIDSQNNLDNSAGAPEFYIYPLVLKITNVTTQPSVLFQRLPFNATVDYQLFANISGTLTNFTVIGTTFFYVHNITLIDSTGYNVTAMVDLTSGTGAGAGQGTYTFTDVTSTGTYVNFTLWGPLGLNVPQLGISSAPFNASSQYWPNYRGISYDPIPVNPWDINITTQIKCSDGLACTEFYAGLNQTLNISVTYPLSPYYNVTSTANYSVLLNGNEVYSGNITIVNNTGSVEVPVNFPENGTVVVKVWDETYHPVAVNSTPLQVVNWNMGGSYQVIQYPGSYNTPDTKFYVGVPANLTLGILYNEPCPANSTVNITLELPNGTVLNYSAVISNANSTTFSVPQTFLFTEPGFVKVTYTDDLGHTYSFSIPVRDWGIFVDASPGELTQNESVNLNVFVAESLYFDEPGERNVTVTLQLPDGYVETKNLTLEANGDVYAGQGGYQGVITFVNVTPQVPGVAWITVTDVLSGKTVKMPIKVNAAIIPGNKWIDVTATPANEPVYAYINNSLKIELQYMYSDGIAAYKDYNDHIVNITITDADGTAYQLQLPVDNGYLLIPSYAIPVNGTGDIAIEVVDAYNSSITGGAVVPVTPWNVTFDFATNGTVWKYVDNALYVTVHVNGPNVPVNVSINGVPYTNVSSGKVLTYNITDPQGTLTFNAIATYHGHQVGSGNYTVTAHEWNVTFDFATNGTVWKYVDNALYVTVHVNGPNVPVNVSINGVPYTNVSSGKVLTYNITDPQGTLTFNAIATYHGHQVGSGNYTVTAHEWNVTFDISSYDSMTGLPDIYMKFFGNITGVVNVNGPNVKVNVSTNWGDVGLLGDGDTFTHRFTQWTSEKNWTFIATYRGHVVGNASYPTYAKSWSTEVSAPDELYYLPEGYTNKNVSFTVDLSGLPEDITKAYNVTIELNVTLPNGTVIHKVVNGTNSKVFNVGNLTFNEGGNITYTITVIRGRPWRAVLDTKSGTIPIKLALDASIVGTYYDKIPRDFVINVYSASNSPNITVTISGTNYTVTAYHDGIITIPNVTLAAGNYTVFITENDAAINATLTRTLEVRSWHLEVVPTRFSITAGSVYNVNFTLKLIDQYGEIVPVNDTACLKLEFSNTSIIPSGFYRWPGIQIVNGIGELSTQVFAPAAGTFQVIAKETFGHMNNSVVLSVAPPNPSDLTYVYVNIRKEGSLISPGKPVVLYWGLEINGIKKYFRVFTPLVEYSPDYSEAMFKLYPNSTFKLYVIAVPNNSKILQPILNESYHTSWNDTEVYANETWYTLINKTAVIPTDNGWEIIVNVSKVKHHFENYTVIYYNYSVPMTPGVIQVTPGSASVQGNAIFTDIENTSEDYIVNETTPLGNATNTTTITIKPNELMLRLCDNTTLKPTQAGEYFTFKAVLSITNAEAQFDAQWMPFESWIQAIDFLNDTEKNEIISVILSQIGNVSDLNGPVANATLDFHIDNTDIAYIEPTNATTDENGSVMFRVYSKALANMTPEELEQLMGAVKVWATYDNLSSNSITVQFGGAGSISGDITDNTGMQIPGATVIVKVMKNGTWVNATDFEGNILTTVSAEDGHYAIANVPAAPNGTEYLVIAIKDNLTGYAYVTVYPFATSTADIKLSGTVEENTTNVRGLALYPEKVDNASTVYFVFNNLGTVDAYSTSQYVARTIPLNVRTKTLLASNFNLSVLNASDVVISVGGPAVNPVTAYYNSMAKVHMIQNGSQWVITTPNGTFTWIAPKPWWNVTKGYFIIQIFEDNQTGAFVVTIYGTDADSTAAGAYYFMKDIYPNITRYNGISYIVGLWEDTEAGADVPLPGASQGDTSGFSAGDTISIVAEG